MHARPIKKTYVVKLGATKVCTPDVKFIYNNKFKIIIILMQHKKT